ncbi:GNAT family N-acetyltransferase [Actinokineospora sp.]|uniref:GNAT family N-acetyltransferase n=1 Tax=Actinokineospora sp. TaxID=1872133 RepID=UPI003D6B2F6C
MTGNLVSLRRITDPDYELLVSWLDGTAGVYANGGSPFCTAAELKEQTEAGGSTYLMVVTPEGERVGAVSWRTLSYIGNYSVGLVIGDPAAWTKGYGAAAWGLLLKHLFHTLNAHRVEVTTGVYNRETMKIVARGILTLEGILRDYAFIDGEYHDIVVCSLLREEYDVLAARGVFGKIGPQLSAEEKEKALKLLLDYLAKTGSTHFGRIAGRRLRERPATVEAVARGHSRDTAPDPAPAQNVAPPRNAVPPQKAGSPAKQAPSPAGNRHAALDSGFAIDTGRQQAEPAKAGPA